MAPQGFRCTEVRKQRRPSTRRLSADQALTERGSQTKRQCPDADQVEAAVLLCPKRAPLRRQRMHSKRRFAVGAGLHTYSPRGVHVTGLLDGFATAAERHFLSPQPVARTHPAVIAGLWFSSAVVGGTGGTHAVAVCSFQVYKPTLIVQSNTCRPPGACRYLAQDQLLPHLRVKSL